jgi:phosphoglycolate phosphatase-like HAD superfamily hydrolase
MVRHDADVSRCEGGRRPAGAVAGVVARHAAIFDMDGILVDSEPHHHAACHRLCLEEGVTLTVAQVAERTLGRPVRESLPTLLDRAIDTLERAGPKPDPEVGRSRGEGTDTSRRGHPGFRSHRR